MEQNEKQNTTGGTIFDDVFRTMLEKMPRLMIPLINEVFQKNYPENERIELMKNEHMTFGGKIITDSHLCIKDIRYHVECQSRPDGTIAIRMFEYDMAIALSQAWQEENNYRVVFPKSCVLYLRHNQSTEEKETVTVEFADGAQYIYSVPIIRVQTYTKDEIFEKRLLLLLPYYIMRYEKQLKEICADKEKLENFLKEVKEIRIRMENTFTEEEERIYADLNKLMMSISDYLLREEAEARKGVDEIMGGKVLELYSEQLLRQGKEEGIKEGREEGMIRAYASLGLTKEEALEKVMEERKLSKEEAAEVIEKYW